MTGARRQRPLPDLPRCLGKFQKGIHRVTVCVIQLPTSPARKSGLGVKSVEVVTHLQLKSAIPVRDTQIDLTVVEFWKTLIASAHLRTTHLIARLHSQREPARGFRGAAQTFCPEFGTLSARAVGSRLLLAPLEYRGRTKEFAAMLRRNARDADLTSSDFDRLQRLFDDACKIAG